MKYEYKNLKHVILHGMSPYGKGIFDHRIEGGGIELIRTIEEKQDKIKAKKGKEVD